MRPRAGLLIFSFTASILFGAAPRAPAQTAVDGRVWVGVTLQERSGTTSPWRWSVETQLRTRDGLDAVDVFTVRPSIGYDLTRRSSVWLGYAESPSFPAAGGVRQEHRLFEQYVWSGAAAGGTLSSRSRLEQRRIETDSALAWRLREQVRFARPVGNGSRTSLVVWDEFTAHLRTTTLTTRGMDQNRVFAGLSRSLPTTARVEAGYLNQFIKGHGSPNRMNHILLATLALTY